MCAIAGAPSKEDVVRMLELMRHRAPDDAGTFQDERFTMGMGRLKIIDLISNDLCPITHKGLTLTFNGEIYNYIDLREELKKIGHTFKTSSDTEVLLVAYIEWNEGCLDKLNGMFAFAVNDGQSIFLARDIAGEKPLYYSLNASGEFKFASEAKALGFACQELPPAHSARFHFDKKTLDIRKWWQFTPKERDIDFESALKELDTILADSVRLRTRSDVSYGLYFSGGIDSTLISTYHNFSNQFTYQDGDYQKEFREIFPKILWHLDYPVSTFSPFGLWKLAEEARSKNVKVVLSGEGADELFGGYVRYVPNEFNRLGRNKFPSYTKVFPHRDMLWEEFNGNMRELLRMGDRMASAWGVENRCPFLDRRIIEFAFTLPMSYKIRGLETKVILCELLKRRMPEYKFQEKHGLFCSVNKWLNAPDEGFDKTTYHEYQEKIWSTFKDM
ncbi:MAG: hypothetical protein HZA95_02640 [Candidatus Vogelbacteria bacterium]|nr:hypothetical protein [Candidatus Vogelbacteria bacterium]